MAEIDSFNIGGTLYTLPQKAQQLNPGASIDGVSFNGTTNITHYAVCPTSASVASKAAYIEGFSLVAGAKIAIKFSNADTSGAPTLNVSNTGAVAIKSYGTSDPINGAWKDNEVVSLVYDGTYWMVEGVTNAIIDNTFTIPNAAADAKATGDAIGELNNHFDNVVDSTTYTNNLYNANDPDIQTGGIILSNGSWYAASGFFETGFIPFQSGDTIYFSAPSTCHVTWYNRNNNDSYINGATSTAHNESTQKITITTSYVNVVLRIGLPSSLLQTAYIGLAAEEISGIKRNVKDSALENPGQWKGKKWYAFGTSLTDNVSINANTGKVVGKYSDILAEMSGMTLVNKGVSGGTFDNQIKTSVLNTDVSDADLITIEGCVNDFAVGTPIGEYGDYASGTIYGDMYIMAKHCCEGSNALVVFITDSTGKLFTPEGGTASDLRFFYKKSNGLTQGDYNEAIKKCASYMGIPCIDAGGESSIDFFHPEYIADQIHHTDLGGEQYAKTIWNKLKYLHPISVDDN